MPREHTVRFAEENLHGLAQASEDSNAWSGFTLKWGAE